MDSHQSSQLFQQLRKYEKNITQVTRYSARIFDSPWMHFKKGTISKKRSGIKPIAINKQAVEESTESLDRNKVMQALSEFSLGLDNKEVKTATGNSNKKTYKLKFTPDKSDQVDHLFFCNLNTEGGEGKELLEKIVSACKLEQNTYEIIIVNELNDEVKEQIFSAAFAKRAKNIFSFGGQATNLISGELWRLQNVHGKATTFLVECPSEKHSFSLIPLFHPDYLLINPKMKRAVWEDLKGSLDK